MLSGGLRLTHLHGPLLSPYWQLGTVKRLTRRLWLHSLGRGKERLVMRMERAPGQAHWALKAMEGWRPVWHRCQVAVEQEVCSRVSS